MLVAYRGKNENGAKMDRRILVLYGAGRLLRYPVFFGENCIPYRFNLDRFNEDGETYLNEVRQEISEIDFEYIGVEGRSLFWAFGLADNMGYMIDARDFFGRFVDLNTCRIMCVDMNDKPVPMFDLETLRDGDLLLKGQLFSGDVNDSGVSPNGRMVWAPYWTGHVGFSVITRRDWSSFSMVKNCDVCFIGTDRSYRWRKRALRVIMNSKFSSDVSIDRVRAPAYVKRMLGARICLNLRGAGPLAQRFFEIQCLGSCCLTDSSIDEMFWAVHPNEFSKSCEVFKSDNVKGLMSGIRRLIGDPDLRVELEKNGKEFWRRYCSAENVRRYGELVLSFDVDVVSKFRSGEHAKIG